eukprot:9384196-Pyramimonas_sp.AAC.1
MASKTPETAQCDLADARDGSQGGLRDGQHGLQDGQDGPRLSRACPSTGGIFKNSQKNDMGTMF